MIILPDENVVCCICDRKFDYSNDMFFGKKMWYREHFCCGHEIKYLCPSCKENIVKCSVCSCGEVYC